jgi:carbamoyltransferase
MYIVGMHNDEDSGVCLIKDGEILSAINEERLNRIKLYKGLPEKSLSYVLKEHDLDINMIDYFVYGWHGRKIDYRKYSQKLLERTVLSMERNIKSGEILENRLEIEISRDDKTRKEFEEWLITLGIPDNKIKFVDHHKSHAWSAYACSSFNEAVVFTIDGRGDLKSSSVSYAANGQMKEIDYQLSFDSLGFLYGQITHYLGYMPHRHEGKITGLAAHGDPDTTIDLFRSMIDYAGNGRIIANIYPYKPFYTDIDKELTDELDKFSSEDISAGLQKHCEEVVSKYITYWIKKLNKKKIDVCLCGGVTANVKINQVINELDCVNNIFVFPHMGDGGLPMGSAIQFNYYISKQSKFKLNNVYLGASYSNIEIIEALNNSKGIRYEKLTDKVDYTVNKIASNCVIGWFEGRMEYGPRSLGARSIIYHTKDKTVNRWLNKRLNRTEFMPFAPVTPEEYAGDCYIGWKKDHISAKYMTRTYECTDKFIEKNPAVVHVDGTARPQIVYKDDNTEYYNLVKKYCDLTGEKALINTSFNHHEEPIVCSPEDAIKSLINGNIDVLVMGEYAVYSIN